MRRTKKGAELTYAEIDLMGQAAGICRDELDVANPDLDKVKEGLDILLDMLAVLMPEDTGEKP